MAWSTARIVSQCIVAYSIVQSCRVACLSEAATPKIGIKFCACVGWRRLLYNSVEQIGTARASVGAPSWRRVQGEPFPVCAPSRTPTIPTVYVRCLRCMYTISLCIYADSRMIGPPRTPALGYEFFNKKLIRGSRRMDAVAAKSDVVTAWKCTATDAYRRLQTLTDAYRRWFPVRGFCSFRVWPCQSVPQCDWALRPYFFMLQWLVIFISTLYLNSYRLTRIVCTQI